MAKARGPSATKRAPKQGHGAALPGKATQCNRNPDGTFGSGNGFAPGNPSRRNDNRWHLRRELETNSQEHPHIRGERIYFSRGQKAAARAVECLEGLHGTELIKGLCTLHDDAYGRHTTYEDKGPARPIDDVRKDLAESLRNLQAKGIL